MTQPIDKMYRLYIDKHGILRMVMEEDENDIVRGIDVSNMYIHNVKLAHDLEFRIYGHGNFNDRRNKVIFKD